MTLRQKILLLGLVATAGMLSALWLQYKSYAAQFQAIEAMAGNIKVVDALSGAVHQLQRERGLTAMASSRTNGQALAEQIRLTDAALAKLAGTGIRVAKLGESLAALRTRAATAEPLTALAGYSTLLQGLIDEMDRLTREPEAAVAKADISAHTHLMAAKEYLGQIRATVGYWIERKRDDPLLFNSLIRTKSLHEEASRKFELEASPVMAEALAAQFSGREIERTLRTVALIAGTGKLPPGVDAPTWWAMATAAIDQLKIVEDRSLQLIEQKAEGELAQLRNAMRLSVLATVAAGLAVLVLAASATISLLRALDRALSSMERIAASQDFHSRIPADSPDEIGRISRSFNHLLDIAERLLNEKEYLATTDPLTGIHNRLQFAKVLGEEAERKRRSGSPMALILFDIDHFKRINDSYGHNVGDEVLQALATLVRSEIRTSDFFGRWGGEEFVLLLRDDGCDAAIAAAEKLRGRIAATDFPRVGTLTCSFGVAAWKEDDSATNLIARADEALYRSKGEGRNRVSCEKGSAGTCRGRGACAQYVSASAALAPSVPQ